MRLRRFDVFDPFGISSVIKQAQVSEPESPPEVPFNGEWQNLVGDSGSIPGFSPASAAGSWLSPPNNLTYSADGGVLDLPDNDGSDYGHVSALLAGLASGGEALIAYKMNATHAAGGQAIGLFAERVPDYDGSGMNQCKGAFTAAASNSSVNGIYNMGVWDFDLEEGSLNENMVTPSPAASNVYQANTLYYLRVQRPPATQIWRSKLWRAVDSEPISWQVDTTIPIEVGSGEYGLMADGNGSGVSNTIYFKWIVYAATGTADNPDTFTGTLPDSWLPS